MPTPQSTKAERINVGDRVRIHPANGLDAYRVTLTDLGAWGMTAKVGARLVFLPWSAVDLVEREAAPSARTERPDDPEAWCEARVSSGKAAERCDLVRGHDGPHLGEHSGRAFGSVAAA